MSARLRSRMAGFSLVELMVALTLSLLLLTGALSVLYSSRVAYNDNERIARIQEAGRTVMELLLRDVRASGFVGCARPANALDFANGINGATGLLYNLRQPLFGFEGAGGNWSPALDAGLVPSAIPGTDVVAIRTSRQGQPVFRTSAPVASPVDPIVVDRAPGASLTAGTTLVISDCRGASAFVATGFSPGNAGTATITHAAGGAPGNVTNSLTRSFDVGAQVVPVATVIYYVRPSPTGNGPSLWQKVGAAAPQSLIEGVENLQLAYGIDTDGDLLANAYVPASAVTNWDDVISLSVAVLVRSELEVNTDVDRRSYDLLGTVVGPFNDRRLRAVFTTTVTLRNRTA